MNLDKVYNYDFSKIYQLYLDKIIRKEREESELMAVLCWLTGYDSNSLSELSKSTITLGEFINESPAFNPNAHLIKGLICGVRVEDIEERLYQKIRYMDKLVDELAKGKKLNKIMREEQHA